MQLLNFAFFKFVLVLAICVVPGVIGIYFVVASEEAKREMRNKLCSKLFGVSNAIEYPKFARFLYVLGGLMIFLSAFATWFKYLRKFM